MRLLQLPEGVVIPDEALDHINEKALLAPENIRLEYTQLLILNWIKMEYQEQFVKDLQKMNEPIKISDELQEFLEEA